MRDIFKFPQQKNNPVYTSWGMGYHSSAITDQSASKNRIIPEGLFERFWGLVKFLYYNRGGGFKTSQVTIKSKDL